MKVFYARCSTLQQNIDRQLVSARECEAEKIFIDKASGKNTNRPQLKEMLNFVREGDTVIVSDISRLGRNTVDLLKIVNELTERGVEFKSLKENIDTTTIQGKFMLSVFSALSELERESILQRQREGIELAKAQHKYKGRKRIDIDEEEFKRLCTEWRAGERSAVSIMRKLNLTSQTFYRRVKEYNL